MALCREVVEVAVNKYCTDFEIKPKQFDALFSVLKKKDTLCILPTSFGKSLVYQLLPSVCKELQSYGFPEHPLVVIISPLVSLISDQVNAANRFSSLELNASSLDIKNLNVQKRSGSIKRSSLS